MSEETPSHPGSATPLRATVAALLAVGVAAGAYAVHERSVANQLADQNGAVTSTLNTTRDQMSALTTKLDAMNAERTAEKAAPPHSDSDHSAIYRKPVTAASMRRRIDDPRWKKVQGQLDEQGKQIDSTRQDLANAHLRLPGCASIVVEVRDVVARLVALVVQLRSEEAIELGDKGCVATDCLD